MAYFSPLDDGSYSVELENGRRLRTAVDPVEYGYELRPPEEVASYAPQPMSAEQRLQAVSENLDKMRRENDPDYRAFAEEQGRQREAEKARGYFENEGLELKADRDSRTTADFDSMDRLGGGGPPVARGASAPDTSARSDAPKPGTGNMPSRAELVAAEGRTDEQPQRTRFVPAQQQSAGLPAQSGQGRDPVKGALSDYAAKNLIRRTGPSKGGFVPTTVTTQREGVPSVDALANVEQKARETDATGDAAIAARADALRQNVIQPSIQAVESDLNSLRASYQQRKAVDEEQARLKKYAEDTERKAADMPRVNARADYWADKGAFARVLYALSAGAFQFGQMLAGQSGPNLPIEMTEAAIADNAEKLRAEHEDAAAAGKVARNAYSEHLAAFGDRESAMKALRLEGQAITDRMKGLRIAQHGSLEEQAAWEVEKAQRAEQRAREYADLSAKAAGSTVSSERYVAPSSGGNSLDPKMIDLYLKLNPDAKDEDTVSARRAATESRVRLPPKLAGATGQDFGFAKDATQAKDAEVALQRGESGLDAIRRMKEILGPSGRPIVPKDRAAAQAAMTEIQTHLASPFFLQQQTGEELELTKKLTGNQAVDLFGTGTVGQGIEALNAAERAFKRTVNAYQRTLTKSYGGTDVIVPNYEERR
jgi:hypothetical protein